METNERKLKHKEWRRIAKKERRRKIRRQAARERAADEDRLRETLERSADYLKWVEEQENLEKERELREKEEHDERERLWLEAEVKAQKEWQELQEKRSKARAEKLRQEEMIRKEFEAKQELIRKKKEEAKRLQEEEMQRQAVLQAEINRYIDEGAKTPEALRAVNESQPGKEPCPFFSKTAACRYGESCSRNHRRPALGKILLIPGFYNHFSMEKNSAEYDTDISLEFERSETQNAFKEFYRDVVPEFELFGRIKTIRVCCNTEIHLRGNFYIEYYSERDAARALRKMKGRYYAGRQLNCEFADVKSWRAAVCGISKCAKGKRCNFLHTFRNPGDQYNIKSPPRWSVRKAEKSSVRSETSEKRNKSSWEESTRSEKSNWRWSESPEPPPIPPEPRHSSRSTSSSSTHSSTPMKHPDKSSSRSHRHRTSSPDYNSRRKSQKHRHESNKENGRSHRTTTRSRRRDSSSPRKSKKSKWDRDKESVRSRGYSSPEEDISSRKSSQRRENEWDTTDSEPNTPERSKNRD